MITNMHNYCFHILGVLCLLLAGCGLGGGGGGTGEGGAGPQADNRVIFTVQVKDGFLSNTRVRLVSLREGTLANGVTNAIGESNLVITQETLAGLNANDKLYVFADSVPGSMVQTKGGSLRPMQPGQAKLKSFLPKVSDLRLKSALFKPITSDPQIRNAAKVSHLSNAKALMMEQQLKKQGILAAPIEPDSNAGIVFSTDVIDDLEDKLEVIETEIVKNPPTEVGKKFKLIAAANKAMVEKGINTLLLTDDPAAGFENSLDVLLDFAANGGGLAVGLHPDFDAVLDDIILEVSEDFQDPDLAAAIPSTEPLTFLITLDSEDTRSGLTVPPVIERDILNPPSIDETTKSTISLKILLNSKAMQSPDGIFRLAPEIKPVRASLNAMEAFGITTTTTSSG